jgi:hypothetical protein
MLSLYGIKDLGSLQHFIQMEQSRFNAEIKWIGYIFGE